MRRLTIAAAAIGFACGIFAFLTNPIGQVPGTDSSIFYYLASCLRDGWLPYRDVFDQKGVLLYLIDLLAVANVRECAMFGTWCWGAWLLDSCACGIGLALLWRCAVMVFSRDAHDVLPIAILPLILYYHVVVIGGNMPEMWILVFSSIAYLRLLLAMRRSSMNWQDATIVGICIGLIFLLKLNMITIGLPAFIVAWLYGRKKLLGMIFGFALAVLPVVFWYAAEDALGSIWEVYIQYNATYAARAGRGTIFTLAFWPVLFVAVANGYAALREREAFTRRVLVINLFYLLFSWSVILLSGGGVRYYCPIMPSLILPMAWVILELKKKVSPQRFWRSAITLCALCAFAVAGGAVWRNMGMRDVRESYAELRRIGKVIQDRSSVTVLGCDCYAYLVLGATCPGRFPFQGTIAGRSEKYREEMIRDLRSARSRYLVVPKAVLETPGELGVAWAKEPILARYRVVASCRGYDIYEANGNDKE